MPRGKHPCKHRNVDRWDLANSPYSQPGERRRLVWCQNCGAHRMEYVTTDKDGEDVRSSWWLYWYYPHDAYKTGRLAPWDGK